MEILKEFFQTLIEPHNIKIWKIILAALWGIMNASVLARYLIDKAKKGALNFFVLMLILMLWWAIHDFKEGLSPLYGVMAFLISILFSKGQVKYIKKQAINHSWLFKIRQSEYDVFISYKSKDANLVRRVVDVLKANGLKVWFAESNILLVNYEDFENEIREGIERSKNALLFTNQEWYDSAHCNFEMNLILEKSRENRINYYQLKTGEIKDVAGKFPELENYKLSCTYSNSFEDLIRYVGRFLSCELFLHEGDGREKNIRMYNEHIEVDMSLLARDLIKQDEYYGAEKSLIGAYQIEGLTEGPYTETYMFVYYFGKSEVLSESETFNITSNDDREIYNHYRVYADKWLKNHEYYNLGLHLFHFNENCHFAFTYTYPAKHKNMRVIEKRYVINTNTNPYGSVEELHVFFPIYFDNRYKESEMLEIMHHVSPKLEDMVNTIEVNKLRLY